jgi:hypothetical protein
MAYERFKKTVNGVDVWYCWLEISAEHLAEVVPEAAHGQEGVELTLESFTLSAQPSLDGTKAIISVGAKLESYGRKEPVDELALATWDSYLDGYDYNLEEDGLDREQYTELVNSLAYKEEVS